MHKITQSHFDVDIETPAGGSAIADVVDEIGTRIHEYANQEDVTADFEIVFEIGSTFSVTRTSPYVLKVVLEGSESADDVLDAIADDLYMMYDEMDSDYTDDAYDLRIDMDITPGRRRPTPPAPPTPPSTPPTPPSDDGGAPDESAAEAAAGLEKAIGDRLRDAVRGRDRLEDRATVARMNRIIKGAGIKGVQFHIEFGDEYSVTEDASGAVQVTLIEKKKAGAETVDRVISDIADVMTHATVQEVDAEVNQTEDSRESAEEIIEQITREIKESKSVGEPPLPSAEPTEVDVDIRESAKYEVGNIYTEAVRILRENPTYAKKALGNRNWIFESGSPSRVAYQVAHYLAGSSYSAFFEVIRDRCRDESRAVTADELLLLVLKKALHNLTAVDVSKYSLQLPRVGDALDDAQMDLYGPDSQGEGSRIVAVGMPILLSGSDFVSEKGLVSVSEGVDGVEDVHSLLRAIEDTVRERLYPDFVAAALDQGSTQKIQSLIGLLGSNDSLADLMFGFAVERYKRGILGVSGMLFCAVAVSPYDAGRVQEYAVEKSRETERKVSDILLQWMTVILNVVNLSERYPYELMYPVDGTPVDAKKMECLSGGAGVVSDVLVPGICRDGWCSKKALVGCVEPRQEGEDLETQVLKNVVEAGVTEDAVEIESGSQFEIAVSSDAGGEPSVEVAVTGDESITDVTKGVAAAVREDALEEIQKAPVEMDLGTSLDVVYDRAAKRFEKIIVAGKSEDILLEFATPEVMFPLLTFLVSYLGRQVIVESSDRDDVHLSDNALRVQLSGSSRVKGAAEAVARTVAEGLEREAREDLTLALYDCATVALDPDSKAEIACTREIAERLSTRMSCGFDISVSEGRRYDFDVEGYSLKIVLGDDVSYRRVMTDILNVCETRTVQSAVSDALTVAEDVNREDLIDVGLESPRALPSPDDANRTLELTLYERFKTAARDVDENATALRIQRIVKSADSQGDLPQINVAAGPYSVEVSDDRVEVKVPKSGRNRPTVGDVLKGISESIASSVTEAVESDTEVRVEGDLTIDTVRGALLEGLRAANLKSPPEVVVKSNEESSVSYSEAANTLTVRIGEANREAVAPALSAVVGYLDVVNVAQDVSEVTQEISSDSHSAGALTQDVEEPENLYEDIQDTLYKNPKYQKALGLPKDFFENCNESLLNFAIIGSFASDPLRALGRLFSKLYNALLRDNRVATDAEIRLFSWCAAVARLVLDTDLSNEMEFVFPRPGAGYSSRSMIPFPRGQYSSLNSVSSVLLPGMIGDASIRPVVHVGGLSSFEDVTARFKAIDAYVKRVYVQDLLNTLNPELIDNQRTYIRTVGARPYLQRALFPLNNWGSFGEGERILALAAYSNVEKLVSLHRALVKNYKGTSAAAGDPEIELMRYIASLITCYTDDTATAQTFEQGTPFDEATMVCEGEEGSEVFATLVPAVIYEGRREPLKALVTCEPAGETTEEKSYAEALEDLREEDGDLLVTLQIPENRRNGADLMLNLLVRLNNDIYRERVGKKLVDEDEEDYYHSLLEMVKDADFIDAVAKSLDHFNGAMSVADKDTVIGDEVGFKSDMSLSDRKEALIVNLANEAYVRRVLRFFTNAIRTSAAPNLTDRYARAADAILDLAVELHNRTSRPANAWSRLDVQVGGQYAAREASDVKTGPARGTIAEVYFQGIRGDEQVMKSLVSVERS